MIPLRDENPSHTVPVVTRALILANVAAFVYQLSLGEGLRLFLLSWGMVPLRLTLDAQAGLGPALSSAPTLLTSMFLHGGWLHLIGNMWYLWIFGDNVEDRFGHVRFLLFYLLSGLAAALAQIVAAPESQVPTIGASGAIAGVLGAYLVAFPRARVITLVPFIFFIQIVALPAVVLLVLWLLFQFVSGAMALGMGGAGGGVAWWAHVGGFVFGVIAMAVAGRRGRSSVEVLR